MRQNEVEELSEDLIETYGLMLTIDEIMEAGRFRDPRSIAAAYENGDLPGVWSDDVGGPMFHARAVSAWILDDGEEDDEEDEEVEDDEAEESADGHLLVVRKPKRRRS